MSFRVAGFNLGKASLGLALGRVDEQGRFEFEWARSLTHEGNPFAAFSGLYAEHEIGECALVAATGTYAGELREPVLVLPEDACQQAALELDPEAPPILNLVSIGGRGYSALSRRPEPGAGGAYAYRFVESDKCSSGTGENILKLTGRFGLDLEEADAMARAAEKSIPITARCSVFAKSEMTHYANEGRPKDELLRGYFGSVARNVRSLLARVEIDGAIYLVGGAARLETLREALEELVGRSVHRPQHFECFEAVGAVALAAEELLRAGARAYEESGVPLVQTRQKRFQTLPAARRYAGQVTMMPEPSAPSTLPDEPVVLGLDLGSTGAKAVLTSVATGEPLFDVYDRTRGNPIEASQRLVRAILESGVPDVRAIALTGSGRQAVATLLGGVFPDRPPIVLNEIVAHATAAIRADPERGRDLSVIEIGGQDAKYIRVSGGRIVESDMNKACSAGTGSFLEEQALLYDVSGIGEFVELAKAAEGPPDLGQMCTVFVADAASEALKDGFTLSEIFGGFQYSVIRNYLNRVMGQRTLGQTVFFQGKPASNPSLAWTLAAITERKIVVPPNPGAMGAWGIGLCATAELGAEALQSLAPLELPAILEAVIAKRTEFQCRDKACQTLCPIERTTVQIGKTQRVAVSGGACPKYEVATSTRPKLPKDTPDPFLELARAQQRDRGVSPGSGQAASPEVAIPHTGALQGYLPWARVALETLGARVRVLGLPDEAGARKALAIGEQLCNSFDSCGPAKVAHAICDTELPFLFFPKVMGVSDAEGVGGDVCVTQQAMPEIVQASLRARGREVEVLRPKISFAQGLHAHDRMNREALEAVARELGLPRGRAKLALERANEAQARYERELLEIGDRALRFARQEDLPIVLVVGELHVIEDVEINASLPRLLRQNGAMAIPVDCLRIDRGIAPMEKVYWGDDKRSMRAALVAKAAGDVFPLMISSFGCGPSSFTEQIFASLLQGYPHTVIESDGHGGSAGFVTRIQAFLLSVRQYRQEREPARVDDSAAIAHTEAVAEACRKPDRDARYVFRVGPDHVAPIFAATYRSFGYDAVAAAPLSEEILELGRRDCSGKECVPYQMSWGSFRAHLEAEPPTKTTHLVEVCANLCRAGVFPIKDRHSLEAHGLDSQLAISAATTSGDPALDSKVWAALVALDLLRQLQLYHRPAAARRLAVDHAYEGFVEELKALVEEPASGWLGGARLGSQWLRLRALIRRAGVAFEALGAHADPATLRTVLVSGDMLTKGSDFASHGLLERLADQGVRVLWEPTCDSLEFISRQFPTFVYGEQAGRLEIAAYQTGMSAIRSQLYALARERSPWLPAPDVGAAIERTRELLDPSTVGNASLTIGSVLHHWDSNRLDGVVMASCWGCDDGLVGESLLRRRQDIPMYFYYDDGTPIDERRLRGFVYRLQRKAARGRERGSVEGLARRPKLSLSLDRGGRINPRRSRNADGPSALG